MTDVIVITLSELSDTPGEAHMFGYEFSPRLRAVLERMPTNSTGTATRVKRGLMNVGIYSLAALQAANRYTLGRKHLGPVSIATIDAALNHFGLHRIDESPPTVVRDGAHAIEANAERLLKWAAGRVAACCAEEDRVGVAGAAHEITEREVLVDVMLILDGREPLNKRQWAVCGSDGCEREAGHDGRHRARCIRNGIEEIEEWS